MSIQKNDGQIILINLNHGGEEIAYPNGAPNRILSTLRIAFPNDLVSIHRMDEIFTKMLGDLLVVKSQNLSIGMTISPFNGHKQGGRG